MNISAINNFLLIIFILVLLLSFYVWKAKPKSYLNISYAIFGVIIGSWIFFNYLWGIFQTSGLILTLTYIVSPYILISMFVWVNYLFHNTISKSLKWFLISLSLFGFLLAIVSFMPGYQLIIGVQNRFEFTTGRIFPIFTVYFTAVTFSFLVYYFYKFKQASKELKKSLIMMTIGIFLSLIIGAMVSFILPIFGFFNLAILDAPSAIFFVAFSAYAILRMQLFDLKIVLTEILTYFVLIISFIILFFVKEDVHILIKIMLMFLFIYGGYFLVRSVNKEVRQKEQLQGLTTQLAQANSHLQELDKMKTEFVSLASHELLTPVSAIEGYLSMLLDEKLAKVEDPTAVKYLDNVYKSAKRLARLVTDLLNISRIEEGRLLVEKQDVNLSDIISQVVDELKFKAEDGHQKIVFADSISHIADSNKKTEDAISHKQSLGPDGHKPSAISYMTFGDGDKIKEIVVNLIGNSIKYSKEPGTITISIQKVPTKQVQETWAKIEAEIKARPLDDQEAIKSAVDEHLRGLVGDEQLLISVKDQGVGIPRDELPRLFKKFHRVGDFTTAESQGTGLGLYISRALVELNHGRIWADSEGQGKGSTFAFSLPLLEHKKEIQDLEAEAPKTGEQLKPLAHPTKGAEEI